MRRLLTAALFIASLVSGASFASDKNATQAAGDRKGAGAHAETFGLFHPKLQAEGLSDWNTLVPGSKLSGYGFTYGGLWASSSSRHPKAQRKRLYLHH
ncbi:MULTISPECIES: hypothetical protein [Caballeronia]|uniref:hypothetical protein n=1 Tax=Caballeronia TaxID=1827195 RepID=UPI000A46A49A|nr:MULTISPECIES: hypothetical protein [Caballeronia]MCE4548154.1 hypothetical protein [Caballeronia sp. PC1]MCE4575817.1 hypothetical protein [Caballeronia sp. CLC5]MDR5784977.1 hypothetical protein [Caballeronia sp. LP003]